MSLEVKIAELTAAVTTLTAIIQSGLPSTTVTPIATPAPVVIPVFTAPPAPVVPMTATSPAAAAMPPPPVFAMPPAAAAPALPFSDSNTLIAYVMGVYKQVGPQKGAGIQNVLTSLGVVNLTDVKPEMYAAFYAGVEALKV